MGKEICFDREFSLRLRLQNVVILLIQADLIALGKLKGIIIILKWGNCRAKAQFTCMGLQGNAFKKVGAAVVCTVTHASVLTEDNTLKSEENGFGCFSVKYFLLEFAKCIQIYNFHVCYWTPVQKYLFLAKVI